MKKIFAFLLPLSLLLFAGCEDYNDNFKWLDEEKTDPQSYTYTITDDDITTILNAIKGTEAEKFSAQLRADRAFSKGAPADTLIPYLLKAKYYTADVKSQAEITYIYKLSIDTTVTGLAGTAYVLGDSEYKSVWSEDMFVSSFTPSKSPNNYIPDLLKAKFPEAEEGSYQNIEYNYSVNEPVESVVEDKLLFEDFEGYKANDTIKANGWTAYAESGSRKWQAKVHSGNGYAQMSANGGTGKYTTWMISPEIDLGTKQGYDFSFDVTVGYWNASCMQVLISTSANAAANPTAATWVDITDKFTIPTTPTNGYGTLSPAGSFNLDNYSGKVYIAYKYDGDVTQTQTTTFQVDNVKVSKEVKGLTIEDAEPKYESYTFSKGEWKAVGASVLTLQPADYKEMGGSYLSAAVAQTRIIQYLNTHRNYTNEGTEQIVAYKTSKTDYSAGKFVYTKGSWTTASPTEMKTAQFVRSTKGWVFDPTIIFTMTKEDYMLVVNYVKGNQALENPKLVNTNGNTEFYYGFNSNYTNITFRDSDRQNDNTYPKDGQHEAKMEFCRTRTIEGLNVLLNLKYPNATPEVSGIEQFAEISMVIYYGPKSGDVINFKYTLKCTGDKTWEFVSRDPETNKYENPE
ncbi:choice-of-anchor J domain-containing protein [Dysgonomonas sp. 520]|uniref:choice-of-anchor J domain-containing protein n=1 Tax=Dysgonomonas sp. 520 TaxID=2302931 RepID=UPI0013D462AA|nr:choice-of-anchor J domain-containing protein [Dysgonomonas sp. 520]NDW10580.1 DUF5017 domain-containing protein [Dysgonomonas sp. 520]